MGGPGSGNWYRWDRRTTLEEVRRLDVRWLHRHGSLASPWPQTMTWHRGTQHTGTVTVQMEHGHLVVTYCYRWRGEDTWHDMRQVIPVDWTSCHYGGQRPWFVCTRCGRRVAVLCGDGELFLCRHCYRLPYASQCEPPEDRRYRKARKLRERIGVRGNMMEPVSPWNKPKGMHWRTWERLRAQEEHVQRVILADLEGGLARLRRGL